MVSKNGNAACLGSRGVPEFDLLASKVDRENNRISAPTQATAPRASRPGGVRPRRKGDQIEREIVNLHRDLGLHAQRVPLSGASRYRGSGHDIDIYAFGADEAPIVAEVKARKNGAGLTTLESWLGKFDALFLRRNHADPLVCLPWGVWVRLLERVRK
jgi:hypothetical protein